MSYDYASVVTPDELRAELYEGATAEGYVAALIDTGDTVEMKYEGMSRNVWFSLE